MELLNEDTFFDGLSKLFVLIPRVCVVVMAAYVSMRVPVLRHALSNKQLHWQHQLLASLFFGILAIIGTHSGIKVDIHDEGSNWAPDMALSLKQGQVIIGFRDLMVLTAGLFGGSWIGFGAGLIAGVERYYIDGGDVRVAGIGTLLLGIASGGCRWRWPQWTTSVKGILMVTLGGTLGLIVFLWLAIPSHEDAKATILEMIIAEPLVNSLGCLLFLFVMRDLESDQLKIIAQQAQLRALQAQIEPHFLNNTLNAIQTLINIEPKIASEYVAKLARFMNNTRQNAAVNAISLAEELTQLKDYLDFQRLRFPGKFQYHEDVPTHLMGCYIAPRSLQTLAENALLHGRRGKEGVLHITVIGTDNGNALQLCVRDNGGGIVSERLKQLGKQVVKSDRGNGTALHHLSESLHLVFNGRARLDIHSQLGQGTEVILHCPKQYKPW